MKNKSTLMSIFLIIVVFGIFFKYISINKSDNNIIDNKDNIYIRKIDLTEKQKQNIKHKNDNEILAFEYSVEDNVKSMYIEILEYTEEGFTPFATTKINLQEDENKGILVFVIKDDKYRIGLLKGEQFSYDEFGYNLHFGDNVIVNKITNVTPAINQEVCIFEKYEDKEGNKYDIGIEDFRKQKCDKGLAITLTFKDEKYQ